MRLPLLSPSRHCSWIYFLSSNQMTSQERVLESPESTADYETEKPWPRFWSRELLVTTDGSWWMLQPEWNLTLSRAFSHPGVLAWAKGDTASFTQASLPCRWGMPHPTLQIPLHFFLQFSSKSCLASLCSTRTQRWPHPSTSPSAALPWSPAVKTARGGHGMT